MTKHCLLLLGLAGAAHTALGQGSRIRPGHYGALAPEAQVRWSNEESFRASERRDSVRLGELLHDDYFLMGRAGPRRKQATVRRWAAAAPPDGSRDAPARVRVQLANARTALLSQDDVHITAAGDTVEAVHETDVWIKENGRWQLYASTGTKEQLGPEVRAIREGSLGRNRAYAAHDTTLLGPLLAPDFQALTGGGLRTGRAANQRALQQLFAQRPGLTLVFNPEHISASASMGTGSESGTWLERWAAPDGPTELRGTYQVLWQRQQGLWRQRALLLVPTACTGGSACAP